MSDYHHHHDSTKRLPKKSRKYVLLNCCLLIPRTTILVIISTVLLAINGFLSMLGFSEIVAPETWRWGVCGITLFLGFAYLIWLLSIIFGSKNRIRKGKGSDQYMYSTTLELHHSFLGFIFFGLVGILWAVTMGVKTDLDFLITVNVVNYSILKTFYLANTMICIILFGTSFNFPVDSLDINKVDK
jgi:hypothetical protein